MNQEMHVDIAVIGAGLTGLTTAYYLKKNKADFVILEEKDRTGGVIRTRHENGFVYEEGPNTGVLGNPDVVELFEDLDGSCICEIAGDLVKKRYIWKGDAWQAMPMGPVQAIQTPLFTGKDKFRILGEPFRKRGTDPEEPLNEMVKRRLGESFLDYAVDPFILGVYSGDPAKLITKYAFPKLYNLEQNYGSFIGGSVKKMFENKSDRDRKATRKVFSVQGGLSNLTDSLYEASGKEHFLLNTREIKIEPDGGQYRISYARDSEKVILKADKVITTIGAYALPDLLPFISGERFVSLKTLKYARVIQAVLGFSQWDGMEPDGFGGLIPFKENRDLLGVLFMSALFSGRAPEGGALFSVFLGGVRREDLFDRPDEEILKIVEREFMALMHPKAFDPDLFRIIRYEHAIPQYGTESRQKMKTLEDLQNDYPGLIIGGNLRDGIGMADRIKQGRQLAYLVCNS